MPQKEATEDACSSSWKNQMQKVKYLDKYKNISIVYN